jgi:hypothetical protein
VRNDDVGGGGTSNGADGEGLIDPDLFIISSTNHQPEGVYDAAFALRTMGTRVQDRTEALQRRWSGVTAPGVYQTPQANQVRALMDPAVDAATDFKDGADKAYSATIIFGFELAVVQGDLKDLESRAREFRDSVVDGVEDDSLLPVITKGLVGGGTVHWTENKEAVEKNEALLKEYAAILVTISDAAIEAAAKIRDIDGMPQVPEPEPWSVDAILSMQMPWGTPTPLDKDPLEQVGSGVWGVATSTVKGLWGLTPLAGGFEDPWDKIKRMGGAWGNLGNGILGAAGFLGALKYKNQGIDGAEDLIEDLENNDDPLSQWLADRLKQGEKFTMPFAGGGSSANMDEAVRRWQDEPWQVGTESALAWLMLLVPGPKGVTKGFPMSAERSAMVQAMADAAGLYQTGSGWFIRGGVKVADASGNWLSHTFNPGKGDGPGGTHRGDEGGAWESGDGGKHKPGKHKD